jgi:hypothetical protein
MGWAVVAEGAVLVQTVSGSERIVTGHVPSLTGATSRTPPAGSITGARVIHVMTSIGLSWSGAALLVTAGHDHSDNRC